MHSVYIETSVWAMAGPGQSPTLQQPTLEFLDQCRTRVHVPHVSDVVTRELRRAPAGAQQAVLKKLAEVDPVLLPLPEEVDELAAKFIEEGILPKKRVDDARHVACAMVGGMDLLVSWNYRHIANVRKAEFFNAIAVLSGMGRTIEIHTPLEVAEWK